MQIAKGLGRRVRGAGVLAMVALVAGCASTPDEPGQSTVQVIVDNSDAVVTDAAIYLEEPVTGERTRLGRVQMNQREFFSATATVDGRYVLVAAVADARITSPTFTLGEGATVQWDLEENEVSLGGNRP